MTKKLFQLEPGDFVVGIVEARAKGPRGGRYVVGGDRVNATLVSRELNPSGTHRVFVFDAASGVAPIKVPSKMALWMRAEVAS